MHNRPNYIKARNTAYNLFEELDIHSFPISMHNIFNQLNIPCFTYTQAQEAMPQDSGFISYITNIADGISYKTKDSRNPYIVFYNEKSFEERIPFTLAHELGHILLHHHYKNQSCSFFHSDTTFYNKDYRDIEADYFAGALLRPAYLISFLHLGLEDIHEIFHVSHQCAHTGIKIAQTQFGTNPEETYPELTSYFENQFQEFLGQRYCYNCHMHFQGAYLKRCPFCDSSSITWGDPRQLMFTFKDEEEYLDICPSISTDRLSGFECSQ